MYADELNADIGLAPAQRISCCAVPTINSMLRGLCREEFTIVAADRDQLASLSGGADPARILAEIIGDLQDSSGRVAIPGFYDDIDALLWPPPDPRNDVVGELPVWPTCEIESMHGNRHNGGQCPVLVQRAVARVSFHLVCDQDPDVIRAAFRDFARTRVSPDCRIEFAPGSAIRPVRFAVSHPAFGKVRDALTIEWGHPAVFVCGNAAPGIYALREALGMEIIVMSFVVQNGSSRGPHEVPELADYRLGIRSWARILDALAH
jgi:acetylornithine deacetylase/succinyl-diaminopimelate desuccinylase-like protein